MPDNLEYAPAQDPWARLRNLYATRDAPPLIAPTGRFMGGMRHEVADFIRTLVPASDIFPGQSEGATTARAQLAHKLADLVDVPSDSASLPRTLGEVPGQIATFGLGVPYAALHGIKDADELNEQAINSFGPQLEPNAPGSDRLDPLTGAVAEGGLRGLLGAIPGVISGNSPLNRVYNAANDAWTGGKHATSLTAYGTRPAAGTAEAELAEKYLGLKPHEFQGRINAEPEHTSLHGTIFKNGAPVGSINRTINYSNGTAHHGYFELNKSAQAAGIGKDILKSNFDHYAKSGINEVSLTANISVGGYAWAKYGFVPSEWSWNRLQPGLGRWLEDIHLPDSVRKAVTDIIQNPDPRSIWKIADMTYPVGNTTLGKKLLLGTNWSGKFNLKDPAMMERFNSYVGR
jgi:hypothetical protein